MTNTAFATKTILLSLCLATAAAASAQDRNPPPPSLTVNGTAELRVEPDLATVRLGVMTQARTAGEAQAMASRKTQAFLDEVKRLLGTKGTVETGRISLYPVFSENPQRPGEPYVPQIAGYRAENTLVVRTGDFSLVGPVIDTAVKAGLNNVEGVTFGLKDDTDARLRALRDAVRQARKKAEAMAEGADVEILGVWEISENSAYVRPYMAEAQYGFAKDSSPTPVIPGAVEVRGDVVVRFFIRPRRT